MSFESGINGDSGSGPDRIWLKSVSGVLAVGNIMSLDLLLIPTAPLAQSTVEPFSPSSHLFDSSFPLLDLSHIPVTRPNPCILSFNPQRRCPAD